MNKRKNDQCDEVPSSSKNDISLTPINQLLITMSLWTIEALIFDKLPLREWNNGNKNGSVIHLDVRDESGEIRIVAFNEFAKQLDHFKIGDTIRLSKAMLKPIDERWCKLKHKLIIHSVD